MLRLTGTTLTESVLWKWISVLYSLQEPTLQMYFNNYSPLIPSTRTKYVKNALENGAVDSVGVLSLDI